MAEESMPNWIQRRVAREQILRDGAQNIWQMSRAALEGCCDSYVEHYPSGTKIEKTRENGIRFRLTLTFATGKKQVLIEFMGSVPAIEVTVDNKTRQFKIDADESHAFVTVDDGSEISFDAFSKIALESALFDVPRPVTPPASAAPYSSHGSGDRDWMR